jgi:adenylate cyclase
VNAPDDSQQANTQAPNVSDVKTDAAPSKVVFSDSILERIKHHKVVQWTLAYAALAYTLLHGAEMLSSSLGWPHGLIRVFTILLLIGAPIAATVAWYHGHRGQQKITASEFMIIALLLALGGAFLWRDTQSNPHGASDATTAKTAADPLTNTPAATAASIAVLPFADLSPTKDQDYFSDGMAEEILNVLAKVKGLDVASRTSSFQFKGRELGIPDIAKQLRVRHIVEGSVRKAGATVRITAQLIDTQSDRHLWSETFDRPLTTDNIFAIQDEIAKAIVKALNETMGTGAPVQASVVPATNNLTAYDLYLQARPLFMARHDLDKAEALLTRAVAQDPHYANAWEMRAVLQPLSVEYGYSSASPTEIERRTVEFANRALAIDPQSALAIAALAKLRMNDAQYQRKAGDYETIIADYGRALAIDPRNASVFNWRGYAYADVGNLKAALANFSRCLELEPYYTPCMSNQVEVLGSLGRDAEALAAYRKALDQGLVSFYFGFHLLARTGQEYAFKVATGAPNLLLGWRRHDELYEAHRHPERTYPEIIADIRKFSAMKTQPITDADLAELIGPIGAYDITPTAAVFWDAAFASYRRSPQFKARIKNFGVYDYWRKHGFPPQCRAAGTDDFACD